EVVDHALERLDLRRQFTGGGAVAAVLDLERRVRRAELLDFAACAPLRTQADKNGQDEDECDDAEEWTQTDCCAAYRATRTVGDHYRVTASLHEPVGILRAPSGPLIPSQGANDLLLKEMDASHRVQSSRTVTQRFSTSQARSIRANIERRPD